jgi:RHS repeat-associated protein
VAKTYDAAGRLLTMNSSVSQITYAYDAANQLTSETTVVASASRTVSYTYNTDGQRLTTTYPDGTALSYGYTGRNQLASVTAGNPPPLASYIYDLAGNRTGRTLENGIATSLAYDNAGRLTSLTHTSGSNAVSGIGYTLNAVGNRTARTESGTGLQPVADTYSYDAIDQVTGVAYGSGRTVNYVYDQTGNRSSVVDSGTTTPYTANALNQYTAIDGLNAPAYDTNGNLTSIQYPASSIVSTYTYDAQNRLTGVTSGSTSASFAYDGRNRCVSRTINGTTTYYCYDGWNLIGEYAASGTTPAARYIHGANVDEILARTDASGTVYYAQDGLGSTIALTDASGTVVERYTYDVYGMPSIYNSSFILLPSSLASNRFLFTGREWLADIGLYDYRNRSYSPQVGRFLQTDPIGFAARDVNLFRYVGNCVVNNVDPTGLIFPSFPRVGPCSGATRLNCEAKCGGGSNVAWCFQGSEDVYMPEIGKVIHVTVGVCKCKCPPPKAGSP